jgi:hypothetical protein
MIAEILASAVLAAQGPGAVTVSPAPPLACQAAEQAMRDQFATMNVRFAPGKPAPGPLGREYLGASDRLAEAMRQEQPDLERIGAFWVEVNRLKIEIGQRALANKTQCDLERLRLMPIDEQRTALRRMAPPTTADRDRIPFAPPAPPAPPPSIKSAPSDRSSD